MENRQYNTEQSNIVIMFYRNVCVGVVLTLLFWIGLGSREKLIPDELVDPLKKSIANVKSAKNISTAAAAAIAAKATSAAPAPATTATATTT
jgi:hypothetical protein